MDDLQPCGSDGDGRRTDMRQQAAGGVDLHLPHGGPRNYIGEPTRRVYCDARGAVARWDVGAYGRQRSVGGVDKKGGQRSVRPFRDVGEAASRGFGLRIRASGSGRSLRRSARRTQRRSDGMSFSHETVVCEPQVSGFPSASMLRRSRVRGESFSRHAAKFCAKAGAVKASRMSFRANASLRLRRSFLRIMSSKVCSPVAPSNI
jgi:hypothetical protein